MVPGPLTRPAPLADDRGVTLAEIVVATAIVSIGLVALGMTIPLSSSGVHQGHTLSTATFLAEQRLEEIRNGTWLAALDPAADLATAELANAELDCLGTGAAGPPTSTTCTRSRPAG